ncbi:MAG: hypothetical protein IKL44_01750 [Clostridia bacterium]|nr:hypothetical protein [Clostridia bacterium]
MKKIIFSLSLVLLLVASLLCPVASASIRYDYTGDWVLSADHQTLTHKGDTFVRLIDASDVYSLYNYEYDIYEDVLFENPSESKRYSEAYVNIYSQMAGALVELELWTKSYGECENWWYVEISRLSEFEELVEGNSQNYATRNWNTESFFPIGDEMYAGWKADQPIIMRGDDISRKATDMHDLLICDRNGWLYSDAGTIVEMVDDNGEFEYYIIENKDYSIEYFYADGTLAISGDRVFYLYKLTDPIMSAELTEFYSELPDDDLSWIAGDEIGETVTLVVAIFSFLVFPLAALVFALIVFKKNRFMAARKTATVMMAAAAVIMICFIIILLLIV